MARKRRRRSTSSRTGGLPWLAAGILTGLLIAGLIWWLQQPAPPVEDADIQRLLAPGTTAIPSEKREMRKRNRAREEKETAYDFYHLLPEMEVVVPEEELASADRARPGTGARPGKPARYLLQVGAFRTHRQADELKARLALLGFEAPIVRIETPKGTWHRVRLGPFGSLRELDRVRHALQKHRIDAIALKIAE